MVSLSKWINLQIRKYFRKKFKPSTRKDLKPELEALFKKHGEGIYYVNLKGRNNNFIAKAIGKYSKGLTHSIVVFYSPKPKKWFSEGQLKVLDQKFNHFYGDNLGMEDKTKCIIMGSADDDGMNYCDFSRYNTRQISVRFAPLSKVQIKNILNFLLKKEVLDACYDYVGLFFWLGGRLIHSKTDWFCSELVYDAFKHISIKVAKKKRPSPAELEEYKKEWIIFTNL